MGADQNFFRNRSVGLYPENHHKPQNLDEVWSSYRRAKPTQISPRNEREKTRKRSRKNCRPHSQGPVRPLALTGQTGRAGFENPDRSDRLHRSVRPVAATGQTSSAQSRVPARELEVISKITHSNHHQTISKFAERFLG